MNNEDPIYGAYFAYLLAKREFDLANDKFTKCTHEMIRLAEGKTINFLNQMHRLTENELKSKVFYLKNEIPDPSRVATSLEE